MQIMACLTVLIYLEWNSGASTKNDKPAWLFTISYKYIKYKKNN